MDDEALPPEAALLAAEVSAALRAIDEATPEMRTAKLLWAVELHVRVRRALKTLPLTSEQRASLHQRLHLLWQRISSATPKQP